MTSLVLIHHSIRQYYECIICLLSDKGTEIRTKRPDASKDKEIRFNIRRDSQKGFGPYDPLETMSIGDIRNNVVVGSEKVLL